MYCPSYLYIPASSESFPPYLLHPTLPVMVQSIIPPNPNFLHLQSLFLLRPTLPVMAQSIIPPNHMLNGVRYPKFIWAPCE